MRPTEGMSSQSTFSASGDKASGVIDILMITHKRAAYTQRALSGLLDSCDEAMRVWVWHNGDDRETLQVVEEMRSHPAFYRLHKSDVNAKLTAPTNWLWSQSDAEFVSKVDDDSLVPAGWGGVLRSAHAAEPRFGCIGCWRFFEEDFIETKARRKIRRFRGGHRLLMHPWVEGSGYVMKRRCIEEEGLLQEGESFPKYLVRLAWRGWVNGWYYPFLFQEHFDDPRSEWSAIRSDRDIRESAPLTAVKQGVETIDDWVAVLRRTAEHIQATSVYPGRAYHLRRLWRGMQRRVGQR